MSYKDTLIISHTHTLVLVGEGRLSFGTSTITPTFAEPGRSQSGYILGDPPLPPATPPKKDLRTYYCSKNQQPGYYRHCVYLIPDSPKLTTPALSVNLAYGMLRARWMRSPKNSFGVASGRNIWAPAILPLSKNRLPAVWPLPPPSPLERNNCAP